MNPPTLDNAFLTRWLNGELTEAERLALEARDDYEELLRIYSEAKGTEVSKKARRPRKRNAVFLGAAMIALLIGAYFLLSSEKPSGYSAVEGEKLTVVLPDSSEAILNAGSDLSFDTRRWNKERVIRLQGEAFLKLRRGLPFRVETPRGAVEGAGARFNISGIEETFEVECYSGRITVIYSDTSAMINAGDRVSGMEGGELLRTRFLPPAAPAWTRIDTQ